MATIAIHARRLRAWLRNRWVERRLFSRKRDWILYTYDRVLSRLKRLPLPGRGRVVAMRLRGMTQPVLVRLGTSDGAVMNEMFMAGEYDPLLQQDLRDVRLVVDLGANVGLSTRLWQRSFPASRVIAVEPDAANMAMCRRNGSADGDRAVTFVEACVAGRSRMVSLDRSRDEWAFQMKDEAGGEAAQAVKALTMQEILHQAGESDTPIDVLKCDVEGAEIEVFANCREWIGNVRHLVVETHAPYSPQRLEADLARSGADFHLYKVETKGDLALAFLRQKQASVPVQTITSAPPEE